MEKALKEAVEVNAKRACDTFISGHEAMQFTQACVNAINALRSLQAMD